MTQVPGPHPAGGAPLSVAEERQWAALGHAGGILSVIPPLVVWLAFRERSAFTADQNREALNFQLTVVAGWVGCAVVRSLLGVVGLGFVGTLLWLALLVGNVVLCLVAASAAARGVTYRYPFALRPVR